MAFLVISCSDKKSVATTDGDKKEETAVSDDSQEKKAVSDDKMVEMFQQKFGKHGIEFDSAQIVALRAILGDVALSLDDDKKVSREKIEIIRARVADEVLNPEQKAIRQAARDKKSGKED